MQISTKGETSKPLNAIGAPQVSLELPIFQIQLFQVRLFGYWRRNHSWIMRGRCDPNKRKWKFHLTCTNLVIFCRATEPLYELLWLANFHFRSPENNKELDPVSRVTGIPGWYWILGIKCSDTTGVGLVYWNSALKSGQGHTPISKHRHAMRARVPFL